jgi:hypothetical protein
MAGDTFEIRSRAELIDALSIAAQVEHMVLLEYLYAAFSCRPTSGTNPPRAHEVTSFTIARELYAIAHDEMSHLGAVQQLLAGLGAPPVPDSSTSAQLDLPFDGELTRLDEATLERFIRTEAPPPPPAAAGALVAPPDRVRFDFLGQLYEAIAAALLRLGDEVFLGGDLVRSAVPELVFPGPDLSVDAAQRAAASMDLIREQGEGTSTADERSHHARFQALRRDLLDLGADADLVSWPCVANPSAQTGDRGATLLTAEPAVALADVGNRTYRALWFALGGTYAYDWSMEDAEATVTRRKAARRDAMITARHLMAVGLRPIGELLARLPAFDGQPEGPTAGLPFEQYGELRVGTQPDARSAALQAELEQIARDLELVAQMDVPAAVGARLRRVAETISLVAARRRGELASLPSPRPRHEPPGARRWLTVDFSGWSQVRLATGGDPYDDPRGSSGWQFALPGEPDLDRTIRWQPAGTFLRDHVDPKLTIGVHVSAAQADGEGLADLLGATVDLLDHPVYEGRNGVVTGDTDEPIVPLRIDVVADAHRLTRSSHVDPTVPPHVDLVTVSRADTAAAADLRAAYEMPRDAADAATWWEAVETRLNAARAVLDPSDPAARLLEVRTRQRRSATQFALATLSWRLRLRGGDAVVRLPDGVDVDADADWWLELVSTGFDADSSCALVRGVLHVPLGSGASENPRWQLPLSGSGPAAPAAVDSLGFRPGR